MGTFSWVHWLLVAIVVLILFGGRGKISSLMGDFAQGIKAFKKGMSEDETAKTDTPPADPKTINHQAEAAKTDAVKTDPLKPAAAAEKSPT